MISITIKSYSTGVFIYLTITLLPLLLEHLWNRKKPSQTKDLVNNRNYYDCVFITPKNFQCKIHLYKRIECASFCSYVELQRLIKFISSAKRSVSLCMYMLTAEDVAECLVKCYNRGVKLRIIGDKVMYSNEANKSKSLINNGIPLKCSQFGMMHHKFCLIDEADEELAKVFFGSLNLTLQGLSTNFDHIIYTNNKSIIQRYAEEFEDLWSSLD